MLILQIEHAVGDFDSWKKVFESDPLDRKKSGVRSYRIFKPIDDKNYVIIELEFDNIQEATNMHNRLKQLWQPIDGNMITSLQSRIIEVVQAVEYDREWL